MSGLDPISFAGVLDNIEPSKSAGQFDVEDMLDDLEGEIETIPALEAVDAAPDVTMTDLLATVKDVSRGVSDRMHNEYLWCDELTLNGKNRLSTQVRATYSTAQKMRASMTYVFGHIHGLGSMHWQCGGDGRMVGNPSVSEVVSRYMLSLHRRKVKAGETATSVRAISAATLRKLYHFNSRVEVRDLRHPPVKKSKADCNQWASQNARWLLQLAFTLAFSCLLRVDEVLKIQSHDFIGLGEDKLQLTLPFQKTSQFGHIKPFVLHKLPDPMAHLCPVWAYAEWIKASRIEDGYTAEFFLEMFRNNLIDIGVDPAAYGTHSFRRGGCQWLASDLRWPLQWICEWGGWSTEFTHLTIVKYLISWNDDPSQPWEDFFNLNRPPACFVCGRSCCCS
ncbi:DNA breaking-rejoining enzyme [Lactarius hengduanensis]|nr:DNA breaking-rejoining enzyme [Lactarius hengduanensis]